MSDATPDETLLYWHGSVRGVKSNQNLLFAQNRPQPRGCGRILRFELSVTILSSK